MNWRALVLMVCLMLAAQVVRADPRVKNVELHKQTPLVLYVVPDLGVRLTFPFILDEQDAYVPFTLNITNPSFEQRREKGRNYFVVTQKAGSPNGMLGNMFITVAGFEISVELRTTNDLSKHYSDIAFQLTKDAREDLIQQSIAQRTAALEQTYKKKMDDLDVLAEKRAIAHVGRLAISKPDIRGVKEEARGKLKGGGSVLVYVDKVVTYGGFSIYLYEIEASNDTDKGLRIVDARVFSIDPSTKQSQPLDSHREGQRMVQPGQVVKGSITVADSSLTPKHKLKLEVLTDRGSVEVEW